MVSKTRAPVTETPYAVARCSEDWKVSISSSTPTKRIALTPGRYTCPPSCSEVCLTASGGSSPSCIAWRDRLNAPEMTAWLAMTVARVASTTIGSRDQAGNSRKNGFADAPGWLRMRAACPR